MNKETLARKIDQLDQEYGYATIKEQAELDKKIAILLDKYNKAVK
jgi:hypothetical protein